MEATVRQFWCPLPEINYVRMIVESYEGLAVVVAPEGAKSGLMEWWIAPGLESYAVQLAERLADEAGLKEIVE